MAQAIALPEDKVVAMLDRSTYQETADAFGVSRGKIYSIALERRARKNEERIRERRAERKARQKAALLEMIGDTQKADVLDWLDALPDQCANLIVTSIPYNVGKRYGDCASADAMAHAYYMGWMQMIISEMSRVLKPGGVLFLQCGSTRDNTGQIVPLDILLHETVTKTGLTHQNRVIWTIGHGLTPKGRLSGRHETALIATRGPAPATFNPDPARTPQKQPGKRAYKGPNKGKLSGHPFGAWPSDVWSIPNVGHNHPEKTGHPAQFPEELAMRAIQLYTQPGDLVLDPFSGSGTVHACCIRSGRSFAGCDLFYEEIRAKRLAGVRPDDSCPLPGVTAESMAVWQAEAVAVSHTPE